MKVLSTILVLVAVLLTGCAREASSPLFRQVRRVEGEGKLSGVLGEGELTAFQGLLRTRVGGVGSGVVEVMALEVDVPEGEGTEGSYLALVRREGGGWELQYYEQSEHMPRTDRAFHRMLTAGEVGEWEGFLREHRVAEMGVVRRGDGASGDSTAEAATRGAETREDENPPEGGTPNEEPLVAGVRVVFRITAARVDGGEMVVVDSPRKGDHPVVDLLGMLKRFRDEGGLAARYFQLMPMTAKSMYADPYRRVLAVWEGGGDLRILVSGAVRPMEGSEGGGEEWLAYKEGKWVVSEVPPPLPEVAATQAATPGGNEPPKGGTTSGGAVVPVDVVVATRNSVDPPKGGTPNGGTGKDPLAGIAWEQMRRPDPTTWPSADALVAEARAVLSVPGIFLEKETWWTEPGRNATVVYHYVPVGEKAGLKFGFVVPAFKFGDGEFAVDGEKGVMYVIHDGQLFSLPVPEEGMGKEAVRRAQAGA